MKRFLCSKHTHHLKQKSVSLSEMNCSICKWQNRPWTLGDFAVEMEKIAVALRFAQEDIYYDPHGITYAQPINELIKAWLKLLHPAYRKNLLEEIAIIIA